MEKDLRSVAAEVSQDLAARWKLFALSAGVNAGILALLHADSPVTVRRIADDRGFDAEKVESWCAWAERFGIVERNGDGFVLTTQGLAVSPHSPAKELLGFIHLTDYFMNAGVSAKEAFRQRLSLDELPQGKVTRDRQPRVSDNLSAVILDAFRENDIQPGDTLLDLGAGSGWFTEEELESWTRDMQKRHPGCTFARSTVASGTANLVVVRKP